ncbi:pca operon transcription factor PcaQ, partial [Pseudomonas syringae]|nr:pca operon transcription factor PcaQ [Pseudomonas syringae]
LELKGGTLVELDMGIREPGGSVGLCSNPALPLTRAAQWCVDELRTVGAAYRDGQYA